MTEHEEQTNPNETASADDQSWLQRLRGRAQNRHRQDNNATEDPFANVDSLDNLDLRWDTPEAIEQSVDEVYRYAVQEAHNNIGWYNRNKSEMGKRARNYRRRAIIAFGVGGIFPVISEFLDVIGIADLLGLPNGVPSTFGTLILAGAGLLIALDQFFGYSSAWMRYITTGMELDAKLDRFQFDWMTQQLKLQASGNPLDAQTAQAFLQQARDFVADVNNTVQIETNTWMAEFRSSIAALNKQVEEQTEKKIYGALRVHVTNGKEAENGWTLYLNDREIRNNVSGNNVVEAELLPRQYRVRVTGVLNGEDREDENIGIVVAGQASEVSLTL